MAESADDNKEFRAVQARNLSTATWPRRSWAKKKTRHFKLNVKREIFTKVIIVLLGENGTGKTTFIRMLVGLRPDEDEGDEGAIPVFNISYKPQKIAPRFKGTVQCCSRRRSPKVFSPSIPSRRCRRCSLNNH